MEASGILLKKVVVDAHGKELYYKSSVEMGKSSFQVITFYSKYITAFRLFSKSGSLGASHPLIGNLP